MSGFCSKKWTKQKLIFEISLLLIPDDELKITGKTFNVDEKLLKHELIVIYNRPDFDSAGGALILLQCFYENNNWMYFPNL